MTILSFGWLIVKALMLGLAAVCCMVGAAVLLSITMAAIALRKVRRVPCVPLTDATSPTAQRPRATVITQTFSRPAAKVFHRRVDPWVVNQETDGFRGRN